MFYAPFSLISIRLDLTVIAPWLLMAPHTGLKTLELSSNFCFCYPPTVHTYMASTHSTYVHGMESFILVRKVILHMVKYSQANTIRMLKMFTKQCTNHHRYCNKPYSYTIPVLSRDKNLWQSQVQFLCSLLLLALMQFQQYFRYGQLSYPCFLSVLTSNNLFLASNRPFLYLVYFRWL